MNMLRKCCAATAVTTKIAAKLRISRKTAKLAVKFTARQLRGLAYIVLVDGLTFGKINCSVSQK